MGENEARDWLSDMDSNHDKGLQRALCYHYTIGQRREINFPRGVCKGISYRTSVAPDRPVDSFIRPPASGTFLERKQPPSSKGRRLFLKTTGLRRTAELLGRGLATLAATTTALATATAGCTAARSACSTGSIATATEARATGSIAIIAIIAIAIIAIAIIATGTEAASAKVAADSGTKSA